MHTKYGTKPICKTKLIRYTLSKNSTINPRNRKQLTLTTNVDLKTYNSGSDKMICLKNRIDLPIAIATALLVNANH